MKRVSSRLSIGPLSATKSFPNGTMARGTNDKALRGASNTCPGRPGRLDADTYLDSTYALPSEKPLPRVQ